MSISGNSLSASRSITSAVSTIPNFDVDIVSDIGKDGGGIYHHIAREMRVPSILKDGEYSPIEWYDVCTCLASTALDEKIQVDIVDTINMEMGEITLYLHTNQEGYIAANNSKMLNFAKIQQKFYDISYAVQKEQDRLLIAVKTSGVNSPETMTIDAFSAFMKSPIPVEPTVLQCFVPSKGNASQFRTYRTTYWLDRGARSNMKTDRLDLNPIVTGSTGNTARTNMNRLCNQEMEATTQKVVIRIQSVFQCRVIRVLCEFVQDVNGKVWFTRTCECLTSRGQQPARSVSPEIFKGRRVAKAAEFGENLDNNPNRVSSATTLQDGFTRSVTAKIGRHSDSRSEKRFNKDAFPNEELVEEIMCHSPRRRSRSRGGLSRGQNRSLSPGEMVDPDVINAASRSYHKLQIPNSRLGHEVPIADSTHMFGSTQTNGCQGDFCNFDMEYLENVELGVAPTRGKLSEFRQKLMLNDKVGKEENLSESNDGSYVTQLIKGTSKIADLDNASNKNNAKNVKKKKRVPGDRSLSPDESANINSDAIRLVNNVADSKYKLLKIAYRTILQARQEMPLVKLQLTRHKRGEKGDYVSEKNYSDLAASSKLPAHYYKEVPCCTNCMKVYSIVDKARDISIKKIMLKSDLEMEKYRDTSPSKYERGRANESKGPLFSSNPLNKTQSSDNGSSTKESRESLRIAVEAIDSLTKIDVAEIRTMVKPHAAVEVVLEAVMCLLLGKTTNFQDTRRLLGGGEAFLVMLREFRLDDVTDARLRLVESYVDNPVFRPENVRSVSYCASKFCSWVLGVVQAARWQRGKGHKRTDLVQDSTVGSFKKAKPLSNSLLAEDSSEELTFVQKLERKKLSKQQDPTNSISRANRDSGNLKKQRDMSPTSKKMISQSMSGSLSQLENGSSAMDDMINGGSSSVSPTKSRNLFTAHAPNFTGENGKSSKSSHKGGINSISEAPKQKHTRREVKAIQESQKKTAERLASQNKSEGNLAAVGSAKEFRCADGITKMPYVVLGNVNINVRRVNFIVVHDFFDTCDATAILFKSIVQRHDGCQVICFNYPGQANTVWPRLPAVERERGAKEPILNNDWLADKLHELLQHAEEEGEILLSSPFHLVGIGNGATIAGAFSQRWGGDSRYRSSLRSLVSVNGFLYPDSQLTSILHSATQLFESTPHNRPDIPISYWSRFVFSEDYLSKINPNLALNIYTAVSNPITNDGRSKLTKGCLQHRDLRGGLAPDHVPAQVPDTNLTSVQIPIILLQSTENMLVNASNVDPFVAGRNTKHLWSHQLNILSQATLNQAMDVNAGWVGKMSQSSADYQKFSILGKTGLRMLLDSLENPRGAFVMWTRSGHAVLQENKAAFMDLIDALACPTEEYTGFEEPVITSVAAALNPDEELSKTREIKSVTSKMEVLFKLVPPKTVVKDGKSIKQISNVVEEGEIVKENDGESSTVSIVKETIEEETPLPERKNISFEINTKKDESPKKEVEEEVISSPIQSKPEELHVDVVEVEEEDYKVDLTMSFIDESPTKVIPVEPIKIEPAKSLIAPSEKQEETSTSYSLKPPHKLPPIQDIHAVKKEIVPVVEVKNENVEVKNKPVVSETIKTILPDVKSPVAVKPIETISQDIPIEEENIEINVVRSEKEKDTIVENFEDHLNKMTQPIDTSGVANRKQKNSRQWAEAVPDVSSSLELEADLSKRQKEFNDAEIKERQKLSNASKDRILAFEREQESRLKKYEDEDKQLLLKLQQELDVRRKERDLAEKQRRLQLQDIERSFVQEGLIDGEKEVPWVPNEIQDPDNTAGRVVVVKSKKELKKESLEPVIKKPIQEVPPLNYDPPVDLPVQITQGKDVNSQLDRMIHDEEDARKRGIMSMEAYEQVKGKMLVRTMERDAKLRNLGGEEQLELVIFATRLLQRTARGYNGRKKAAAAEIKRKNLRKLTKGIIFFQALIRGFIGRKKVKHIRNMYMRNLLQGKSIMTIQTIYRGYCARKYFKVLFRNAMARNVQRTFRGHVARVACKRERKRLAVLRKKHKAAQKIQTGWRMKVAKEEFRSLRIHMLASIELQRCYRGYLGRKLMARRRKWESTAPGPDRIKLGLVMIEESKVAFEKQQEEIDALHRAQERAEARVSHIHAELKDSEKELSVLERELQEIDQIERDLQSLTHERDVLSHGMNDAAGMPRIALKGHEDLVMGLESKKHNDPDLERRRKAEAYALEMTIQIKRAEREKKRQELETEFAAVFKEVDKKRKALERLELSLADMESTRERKDREFRRLQQNLMQLLLEQKQELDDLREKGIELETATATTAAAATATAQKAKEHEQRSSAMFSQTEELMKFQFMSMSLSYFSSLNMLKQLRDMNVDTTTSAVASSANAAAAAAAAATAANLPSIKKMNLGAEDFVELGVQKKKLELEESDAAQKEATQARVNPMPDNVRMWTVADVSRWLDAIFLGQYVPAFREACVDGPFLMELREEDMVQVLGMTHKLHVRKIIVSREKLKPLSQQEQANKDVVDTENNAGARRKDMGVPDLDTVFSQARNGRIKRIEESLNLGFKIDSEDEKGNTLLLVAAQNSNKRLVEMLLVRGSNVNHQNALGNTALHFALAFDSEGVLGEYLIEKGANDTLENLEGLTAYDGVVA
jgi:pimeloyl-ACP methyl ester carboxylesterase